MRALWLSLRRIGAMLAKEAVQMRRDRLTFAMMIGIPLMQLVLFGFAINTDPKHLPTALLLRGDSAYQRSIEAGLINSRYFVVTHRATSRAEADRLLAEGEVAFVISFEEDFSRRMLRGEQPQLLVEADATDPAASSQALGWLRNILTQALSRDLSGPLARATTQPLPFEIVVHRRYNPEGITRYNIVPGLLGVILTMTMVLMTGMSLTREVERGTWENLLAMPIRPFEVMIGKVLPYVLVGYVQVLVVLVAGRVVFDVPMQGPLLVLGTALLLFIAANLAIGFTFSTIARSQLQAMQMTFFFFLPSMLLSGFMFPFRGMPEWAQWIGEILPLTHCLRIVRGVLLKGNSWPEVQGEMAALLAFTLAAMLLAMLRYRRTLD